MTEARRGRLPGGRARKRKKRRTPHVMENQTSRRLLGVGRASVWERVGAAINAMESFLPGAADQGGLGGSGGWMGHHVGPSALSHELFFHFLHDATVDVENYFWDPLMFEIIAWNEHSDVCH